MSSPSKIRTRLTKVFSRKEVIYIPEVTEFSEITQALSKMSWPVLDHLSFKTDKAGKLTIHSSMPREPSPNAEWLLVGSVLGDFGFDWVRDGVNSHWEKGVCA